jgi:hypothetical protein
MIYSAKTRQNAIMTIMALICRRVPWGGAELVLTEARLLSSVDREGDDDGDGDSDRLPCSTSVSLVTSGCGEAGAAGSVVGDTRKDWIVDVGSAVCNFVEASSDVDDIAYVDGDDEDTVDWNELVDSADVDGTVVLGRDDDCLNVSVLAREEGLGVALGLVLVTVMTAVVVDERRSASQLDSYTATYCTSSIFPSPLSVNASVDPGQVPPTATLRIA